MIMQQLLLGYGGGAAAVEKGSVSFDGNGDSLKVPDSSDLAFGTGEFTVEMWFYADTVSGNDVLYDSRAATGNPTDGFSIVRNGNQLRTYTSGAYQITPSSFTVSTSTWYHLAVTRESSTQKMYIDGVEVGSATVSNNFSQPKAMIGSDVNGNESWDGFISNVRLIKGTALYTSEFTVPTAPLTNVTNTKLLCCQSPSLAAAAEVSPSISGLNDGRVFSANLTTNYTPVVNPSYAFNGVVDLNESVTGAFAASTAADISSTPAELSVTFSPAIPFTSELQITSYDGGSGETIQYRVNNGSWTTIGNGSAAYEVFDISAGVTGNQVSEVGIRRQKGNSNLGNVQLGMIEVDGTILKDPVEVRGDAVASSTHPFS